MEITGRVRDTSERACRAPRRVFAVPMFDDNVEGGRSDEREVGYIHYERGGQTASAEFRAVVLVAVNVVKRSSNDHSFSLHLADHDEVRCRRPRDWDAFGFPTTNQRRERRPFHTLDHAGSSGTWFATTTLQRVCADVNGESARVSRIAIQRNASATSPKQSSCEPSHPRNP